MQAIDQTELTLAKAIRDSLTSPEAVALEEKSLTDHSLLLAMLEGATRAAGIAATDNGVARGLASAGRNDTASLQALAGAALDQSFVDREVLVHVESLGLLARLRAPAEAKDPLGYVIESMQNLESQHEAAALAAQRALEGDCDGARDR
jgi:hypothetical protein